MEVIEKKIEKNLGLKILFLMQMSDFLLTWLGVNILDVVEEGNPFMVFLFNLDFFSALIIRFILVGIVIVGLNYVKKVEHILYEKVIKIGILANLIIHMMHICWIYVYIKFTF